jgi:hypothetical protein
MNKKELIEALKIPGRYELYVHSPGKFVVRKLLDSQILISTESDKECRQHFSTQKRHQNL